MRKARPPFLTMVRGRTMREWGEREKVKQVARQSKGEGHVCRLSLREEKNGQSGLENLPFPLLIKWFFAESGNILDVSTPTVWTLQPENTMIKCWYCNV